MGRQNGDPTMVTSSIALLQERFRELQRTREKRQEKELLKRFSSSESDQRIAPPAGMHFDRSNNTLTLQPDMNILPHRPTLPQRQPPAPDLQDSLLCLGLNSQSSKHADFRAPTNLWPNNNAGSSSSRSFENPDVDTSLHL